MFVDASALTAILLGEPESGTLRAKMATEPLILVSAIAVWETTVVLARHKQKPVDEAQEAVLQLLADVGAKTVVIGAPEAASALEAFARFGRGRHPAKLNMGDCFAYACAKANGVPLLYKGDDFGRTDIAAA